MVNILRQNEMTPLSKDLESEFEFMGILNFNRDIFVKKIIQKVKTNKNMSKDDKVQIIQEIEMLLDHGGGESGQSGGIEIDESIPINYQEKNLDRQIGVVQ